jgi:hypothetical protein
MTVSQPSTDDVRRLRNRSRAKEPRGDRGRETLGGQKRLWEPPTTDDLQTAPDGGLSNAPSWTTDGSLALGRAEDKALEVQVDGQPELGELEHSRIAERQRGAEEVLRVRSTSSASGGMEAGGSVVGKE